MNNDMSQSECLDFLVEEFKADSVDHKGIKTPVGEEDKRVLLRSLMNIRMPGDITRLKADAIVNAANSQMLGCFVPMHLCIDNCIHTFAGIQLRAECNRQMESLRIRFGRDYEQPTSVPMLTDAYNLPANKVIHIVGPIVQGELSHEHEKALEDCYRNVLDMCLENDLKSVAFCCISTGVFHFPKKKAAGIAVMTAKAWLAEHPGALERIIFNVFGDEDRGYYEEQFQ